jgi:hypothetical protein
VLTWRGELTLVRAVKLDSRPHLRSLQVSDWCDRLWPRDIAIGSVVVPTKLEVPARSARKSLVVGPARQDDLDGGEDADCQDDCRGDGDANDGEGTRNIFHVIVLISNATPAALPSWLFRNIVAIQLSKELDQAIKTGSCLSGCRLPRPPRSWRNADIQQVVLTAPKPNPLSSQASPPGEILKTSPQISTYVSTCKLLEQGPVEDVIRYAIVCELGSGITRLELKICGPTEVSPGMFRTCEATEIRVPFV